MDGPEYGHLAEADQPSFLWLDYLDVVERKIKAHPRSQQKLIGPSEIGIPCTRALAHKLNGDDEPERLPAWKPEVGTAIHSWLEEAFRAADPNGDRYVLEQRVYVGDIAGQQITGSCDLFDRMAGAVWDHKTKGKTTLAGHRRNGPGEQYRIQAHLYGRGWALRGETVNTVNIAFLGRDSEISGFHHWHEPYNEQIALEALARATSIAQLVSAIGIDATVESYPPCDDHWCAWCPKQRAFSITPQPQPPVTSTASLFASA